MSWTPNSEAVEDVDWIASTARLPLAFAHVREDPWIDARLLELTGDRPDVLMIASGGCTAAWLASRPGLGSIHLVDVNGAQLALARLKLWMLANHDADRRLALLGHEPCSLDERMAGLREPLTELQLPLDVFGPPGWLAEFGPDQLGRYEWLFVRLRQKLLPVHEELRELLGLRDPVSQSQLVSPSTGLGKSLDAALDSVMELNSLCRLFGPNATANRRQPFSRHFAERVRHALATLPAADNPYLWQMLAGRFPDGGRYPWLEAPRVASLPDLTFTQQAMENVLQSAASRRYDLVHLSNILDWVAPPVAAQVLADTARSLRPQGLVVVRQLNSALDIRAIPAPIEWLTDSPAELHAMDRSFFYRELHVGRKKR